MLTRLWPEKMREREGREHVCQQCLHSKQLSQRVICVLCMTSTPQSVWDLREPIRSSSRKIQSLKPCIWQFTREDRKACTLQTKRRNIQLWFVPLLKFTAGDFLFHVKLLTMQLQPILISCSNPDLCPKSPQRTLQHRTFGHFPTNSVISARPEMNAGRVDSGWTVESLLGGRGVGVFFWKKIIGMVASSWGCLAKDQSHSSSVEGSFSLTHQSWHLRELTQEMQL